MLRDLLRDLTLNSKTLKYAMVFMNMI